MTIKQTEQQEITRVLETLEGKTNMDNIVGQLVGELGRNKSMELFDCLTTNRETLEDVLCNGDQFGFKSVEEKEQFEYEQANHPQELEDSLDKIISYLY